MKKDRVIAEVCESFDYEKFSKLDGNRNVINLHVRRLMDSFKTAYLLSVTLVNENFQIIDGQNRFEAAKKMGLPVNYMICPGYGLKEVQMLNTNMKNWKKDDYLNAWCDVKHPEYLKVRNFMREFPEFTIDGALAILMDSLNGKQECIEGHKTKSKFFEQGELIVPDFYKSCEIAKKIRMFQPYYANYSRVNFVRAIVGIMRLSYYDHNRMINKVSTYKTKIEDESHVSKYKEKLEAMYNFRSTEKVSLRFF